MGGKIEREGKRRNETKEGEAGRGEDEREEGVHHTVTHTYKHLNGFVQITATSLMRAKGKKYVYHLLARQLIISIPPPLSF